MGSAAFDQLALADLLEHGELDHHLRRMRPIYRGRRDALLGALSRHLPDLRPTGASAGLHVLAWLPPDLEIDEAAILAAADRAGIAVAGVATRRVAPGPGGLVFGYGVIDEDRDRRRDPGAGERDRGGPDRERRNAARASAARDEATGDRRLRHPPPRRAEPRADRRAPSRSAPGRSPAGSGRSTRRRSGPTAIPPSRRRATATAGRRRAVPAAPTPPTSPVSTTWRRTTRPTSPAPNTSGAGSPRWTGRWRRPGPTSSPATLPADAEPLPGGDWVRAAPAAAGQRGPMSSGGRVVWMGGARSEPLPAPPLVRRARGGPGPGGRRRASRRPGGARRASPGSRWSPGARSAAPPGSASNRWSTVRHVFGDDPEHRDDHHHPDDARDRAAGRDAPSRTTAGWMLTVLP